MSCVKESGERYLTRRSAPYKAKNCKDQVRQGNDGSYWISKPRSDGVYRWVPHTGSVSGEAPPTPATTTRAGPVGRPRKVECGPGRYRNPKTGRCKNVAIAKSPITRLPARARAKSSRTRAKKVYVPKKDCKSGQYRNPETGRCKKVKLPRKILEKDCKKGYYRNPLTNRCKKLHMVPDRVTCGPGEYLHQENMTCLEIPTAATVGSTMTVRAQERDEYFDVSFNDPLFSEPAGDNWIFFDIDESAFKMPHTDGHMDLDEIETVTGKGAKVWVVNGLPSAYAI